MDIGVVLVNDYLYPLFWSNFMSNDYFYPLCKKTTYDYRNPPLDDGIQTKSGLAGATTKIHCLEVLVDRIHKAGALKKSAKL